MQGLDRIFATCENGIPWKVKGETKYDNGITLEGWLGLWVKAFTLNPKEGFKYLVQLGYCGRMKDAVDLIQFKPK